MKTKRIITLALYGILLLGLRAAAQESFTANVNTPGMLAEVLGDKANTIESLTVVGPIDAADFTTMRTACADGILSKINLAQARITDNKIPDFAFHESGTGLTHLSDIVLPDGLVEIGNAAFMMTKLTGIELPQTLKTLGFASFSDCEYLKEIAIPEGVEEIPRYCFRSCHGLEKITFPETLKRIGAWAFYGNYSLEAVTLPESLRAIDMAAFDTSGLKSIHIPAGCTSLEGATFANCFQLKEITFGGGLTRIPTSFATWCEELVRCDIPAGVIGIGPQAFEVCPSLTSIDLPAGLETIGQWAFNTSGLKTLVMPASVKAVDPQAFRECPIEAVYSLAVDPIIDTRINGSMNNIFTCSRDVPVYVPRGAAANYKNKPVGGWWTYFHNFIEVDDVAAAGVDDAMQGGGMSVTASGGAIVVEGTGAFAVYSADGRAIASGAAPARVETAAGLYIVRTGAETVKVRL